MFHDIKSKNDSDRGDIRYILKRDFENDGATAILQIAFLNRDLLTCWYRLARSVFFQRPIVALKAHLRISNLSHFR